MPATSSPGCKSRNLAAHAFDRAAKIVAKPQQVDRIAGVHPQRFHQVAEVYATGPHPHFDFVGSGIASGGLVERQIGQRAGLARLQSIGQYAPVGLDRILLTIGQVFQPYALQTVDIAAIAAEGNFVFVRRRSRFLRTDHRPRIHLAAHRGRSTSNDSRRIRCWRLAKTRPSGEAAIPATESSSTTACAPRVTK